MAARKRVRSPVRRILPPGPGDPEVLPDVECVVERLYLVLGNQGPATAFTVRVEFRRPLVGVGGEVVVSDMRIFKMLPMLRPGQEIRVFIDTRRELLQRKNYILSFELDLQIMSVAAVVQATLQGNLLRGNVTQSNNVFVPVGEAYQSAVSLDGGLLYLQETDFTLTVWRR